MKSNTKSNIARFTAGVFYVLSAAASVALAFLMQRMVDATNTGEVGALITAGLWLIGLWAAEYVIVLLAVVFRLNHVKEMMLLAKRNRLGFLYSSRQKAPAEADGRELSFFTTDSDILVNDYISPRARLPLYIAQFVFALAALIWLNWVVTVAVIVVAMLPILLTGLFAKGLQRRKKAYSDATAAYVDTARECIEGKKEIVAFDKQNIFISRHNAANNEVEHRRFSSDFFEIFANHTSSHAGGLVFIAAMALGSYFVIAGSMTFGAMIAVVQLMNSLMNPINQISHSINSMRSAKNIVEKAAEEAEPVEEKIQPVGFSDQLKIENLGVQYTEGEYALQNVNLSFRKGGKYAIFAPSGYGKSTIAKAIALEFTQFDGTITLDGTEIRDIDEKCYHKILRFVRQDPYVFNDTAVNNLTFFDPKHDTAKLERVMELTRVNEFLPDMQALERNISNTSGLSGGQKQRIVLARALLHAPQVLVLDEITAGIDLETAYNILQDLFMDKELTCVVITHESDAKFQSLFDEVVTLGV